MSMIEDLGMRLISPTISLLAYSSFILREIGVTLENISIVFLE